MQTHWAETSLPGEQEYLILQEWEAIQRELLNFSLTTSYSKELSWREVIDTHITRSTKGKARLYWDPLALGNALGCDRFCEVRFKHVRYGFLGLAPGYLASRSFPDLPQNFAYLCALLITFSEYQALVHYQTDYLTPLFPNENIDKLTRREQDVLLGLMRGESDSRMAERLGIEPSTVHTHRKRLYRRLGVHSAQEATLRSFTHRLIDWLDGPALDRDMPGPAFSEPGKETPGDHRHSAFIHREPYNVSPEGRPYSKAGER